MRKNFMAGNWKMHKTVSEAESLAKELVEKAAKSDNRFMIAPPFTALAAVKKIVAGSSIELGAQNMSTDRSGAHTGEISVEMLKDIGVDVVILGHSERRLIYAETDKMINTKIKLALEEALDVVFCVGETLEQREAGQAEKIVADQLKNGLEGISSSQLEKITIAYEPVWAIGTGKTATPQDADAIHQSIRKEISHLYSADAADKMVIQYGGSVKPANVKELMAMENIDGALVGGASLTAENFLPIMNFDK